LFNLSDKIIGGNVAGDYLTWRRRVLADSGELLDDDFVNETISTLQSEKLYDKFSTLYTPNARKASKMYSLISSAGDATVARASVKNVLNQSGVLEQIANDVTPSSYLGDRWGALVEPSATNLLPENINIDNWASPDNVTTENSNTIFAYDIDENPIYFAKITADAGTHVSRQIAWTANVINVSSAQTYTSSIYLKKDNNRYVLVRVGGHNVTQVIDLELGLITRTAGESGRIISSSLQKNGDIFFYEVKTNGATSYVPCQVYPILDPDITIATTGIPNSETFDGDESVYAIGAQAVIGEQNSSLIFTGASTATRSADTISLTGASDLIGQTEGTVYALFNSRELGAFTRGIFSIGDGTVANRVSAIFSGTAANRVRVALGTSLFLDKDDVMSGMHSFVCVYRTSGSCELYFDGEFITSIGETSFSETMSNFYIGAIFDGSAEFNDHLMLCGNIKTALTESEAIALSGAHL